MSQQSSKSAAYVANLEKQCEQLELAQLNSTSATYNEVTKTHNYIAKIDLEVSARELVATYINGNRNEVIDALSTDHPGLLALVLVQGVQDGKLSRSDFNTIANRVIDRRRDLCL